MDPGKAVAVISLLENKNKEKEKERKSLACFVTPLLAWLFIDRYTSAAAPSVDIIKRRSRWIMRCAGIALFACAAWITHATRQSVNSRIQDSDCWQRRRRCIWHHRRVCSHTHSMQILSGGWEWGGCCGGGVAASAFLRFFFFCHFLLTFYKYANWTMLPNC